VQIAIGHASFYVPADHEAASKFVGQYTFSAKYSADDWSLFRFERIEMWLWIPDLARFLDANRLPLRLKTFQPGIQINFYGLPRTDPVQCDRTAHVLREKPMKKLVFAVLLICSPAISSLAWAQTKLLPKSVTARVDNCAPIGRTEDGRLVYSMKCENLPAPTPPPPQAEVKEAPPPEPEVQRSGIFGLSYERKRPEQ